jgi:hypothetical protein
MRLFETTGEVTEVKKDFAGTHHVIKMDFLGGFSCKVEQNPNSYYDSKSLSDFVGRELTLTIETKEAIDRSEPIFRAVKAGE